MHQIQIQTDQGRSIPWTPHENAGIACAIVDGETITGATLTICASAYRISPALLMAFHATGRDGGSMFDVNFFSQGFSTPLLQWCEKSATTITAPIVRSIGRTAGVARWMTIARVAGSLIRLCPRMS